MEQRLTCLQNYIFIYIKSSTRNQQLAEIKETSASNKNKTKGQVHCTDLRSNNHRNSTTTN